MKILLTLFALFFSSLVVANDDLTGKSIVCIKLQDFGKKNNSETIVKMHGFDFLKNNKVDFYFLSTETDEITYANFDWKIDFIYSTKIKSITVLGGSSHGFSINRETLEINDGNSFSEGDCQVFVNEDILFNMKKIQEKFKQKILKKNKI